MLHLDKELPNDSGRLTSYNNFPIKSKMAAANNRCFLRFLYFTESSPPSFKVRGFTHDYEFGISVSTYQ